MKTSPAEYRSLRVRRVANAAVLTIVTVSATFAQTETISVNIKLRTGGALAGLVVDHTEHGLVIVHQDTPYVFAWTELEAGSAYAARRTLMVFRRGGTEKLLAKDHFYLGSFALAHGRNDIAANEFRDAKKLDAAYGPRVREAFDEFRRRRQALQQQEDDFAAQTPADPDNKPAKPASTEDNDDDLRAGTPPEARPDETELANADTNSVSLADIAGVSSTSSPSPEVRAEVSRAYRKFGEKVRAVMGKNIELVETDHFLIWTDWPRRERSRLSTWCESMYSALCEQFGLDPREDIFLAKCPVFCLLTKSRFRRFAREFDGYDGTNAIGYTRSIEQNGHVHMVLARPGRSREDLDRLACTLVHEGTHAFLHRLHSSRLIPHWINEGYADLTAARVLGDRCPASGNAELLARQYVKYDWSIGDMLESAAPPNIQEYPLAHSVVAYLEALGRSRFAGFIMALKDGQTTAQALAANFDGLTIGQLEANWRDSVRQADRTEGDRETR